MRNEAALHWEDGRASLGLGLAIKRPFTSRSRNNSLHELANKDRLQPFRLRGLRLLCHKILFLWQGEILPKTAKLAGAYGFILL